MELILVAIPFFFILIALELWTDKRRGTGFYQFNDAISSLNLGVMSRLTGIFKLLLPATAYVWLYQHYAFWQWPNNSVLLWVVAFIFYDLGYYWVHRMSHRVHVMWGSHVVHHSSEEYNLTTALRQTGSPAIFAWLIFLPMALLGIPPEIMLACASLNLIYQFWVHTRHINKLHPWFEALFVTPSHHRVHHALNRDYIDKNYAGVFIIWDKIFGSFAAEKPDVDIVYGVSQQLNSYNPIKANLQVYGNILQDVRYTRRWSDKLKCFLMPPGWRAEDVKQKFPRKYATTKTLKKYQVTTPPAIQGYVLLQFTQLVICVFVLLLQLTQLPLQYSIVLSLAALLHCWLISAIQENKAWLSWAEPLRLMFSAGLLVQFSSAVSLWMTGGILCFALLQIIWFMKITKRQKDANDIHLASPHSDA